MKSLVFESNIISFSFHLISNEFVHKKKKKMKKKKETKYMNGCAGEKNAISVGGSIEHVLKQKVVADSMKNKLTRHLFVQFRTITAVGLVLANAQQKQFSSKVDFFPTSFECFVSFVV